MPLAREVVKDLAVEHGACIRPIQLRRTNLDTGETEQVLVPCGHTLAPRLPVLRRTGQDPAGRAVPGRLAPRGRTRPDPGPGHRGPAVVGRRCAPRPSSSATRPPTTARTPPTSTSSSPNWTRKSPGPACAARCSRTGLPGGTAPPAAARTPPTCPAARSARARSGKTYTAPDGKTFRPSMFVTLTCPSYGRVDHRGVPVDPAAYDYDQAARDALTFAALFDRFIQNLRRYLGHDVQYFAAVEPQRRLAPHVHIAIRGTIARAELRRVLAATYHQVWWPDTTVKYRTVTSCPSGTTRPAGTSTRPPGRSCPTWDEALDGIGPYDLPWHVARFGDRFDAQGVLAGSPDAARCIGYLTKYLTKQVGGCHQADTDPQSRPRRPAGRGAALAAVLAAVRELAPLRHPAQERPARPGPRPVQGQGPRRRSPRLRRAAGAGLPQVVRQDPGRPPRRPERVAAADPRCFGNRPGPVRLGTRRTRPTRTTWTTPGGCCTSSPTGSDGRPH